ncbi:MAG: Crp/Fnr family transcriptional regulator [Desulfovibrio sp.]|uniref:Crp/Fnr family transcriptional regulator n=1 Tax=Desulfovibrio sp. TaxID=885 RepID=UPI0039E247EE
MSFAELVTQNHCWKNVSSEKPRLYTKGSTFDDGYMYFLVSGRLRLTALSANGGEKIIWYLGEGCCFNEIVLFLENSENASLLPSTASFRYECMEDCYVQKFTSEQVRRLGKRHPELLLNLCQSYSVKVALLAQQVVSLSVESHLTRVCKFLASRIIPGSNPMRARRDLPLFEMAGLLGMHRITLYKALRTAQSRGLLTFDKNSDEVVILQPETFFYEAHGTMPGVKC